MTKPGELLTNFRELGPGFSMLLLGSLIVIAVLSLLGVVYPNVEENNYWVNVISALALILGIGLVWFGYRFLRGYVESNLYEIGMVGRRFLDGEEVLKRLRKAKSITIVKTWFPDTLQIENALEEALGEKERASIKLILCKRTSEILKIRCEGAGPEVNLAEADRMITDGLNKVRELLKKEPEKFNGVAFHEAWPGCPVITVGNQDGKNAKIYMGFYFRGNSSPNFPWVEIRHGSTLAGYLKDQENELWNLAKKRGDVYEDWAALDKLLRSTLPGEDMK